MPERPIVIDNLVTLLQASWLTSLYRGKKPPYISRIGFNRAYHLPDYLMMFLQH